MMGRPLATELRLTMRSWSTAAALVFVVSLATLFALARTELPLAPGEADGSDDEPLIALVEALSPCPAYLLGPFTRILAWNAGASAVLGAIDHLSGEQRSLLWWLLVDYRGDAGAAQWEVTARNTLARFRSEYARHAGNARYDELVASLHERSAHFAALWAEHEVAETQRGTKTIEHPRLGRLRLHHAQTVPTGAPDLRLTVYAPADKTTRAVLATL